MKTETLRRLIVGVMGSGREEHRELAEPLGEWIAMAGFHLLTGGGGGVMTGVSRAFARVKHRKGLAIGVLPGTTDESGYYPFGGYPNDFVDIPIRTHLPLSGERGEALQSRNHINVLTADLLIALPGSAGTASEVRLAVKYKKPIILYLGDHGMIEGLPAVRLPRASDLGMIEQWVDSIVGGSGRNPAGEGG